MSKTPERFIWTADLLDIKATDRILEIGCGAGLLAELIGDKLTEGHFIAVDKSAAMVEKAKKRNKKFIDSGTSRFLISEFSEAELPPSYFDNVVAFNVNFFGNNLLRS